MAENKTQENKKSETIKVSTQLKEIPLQSTREKALEVIKEQRKKYETKVVLALSEVNAILKEIENVLK